MHLANIARVSLTLACLAAPLPAAEPQLIEVRKIWDLAPHNAFTDLIRYKGAFYCVFREGSAHVSPDGKLRVLTSKDGREWSSAALLESAGGDLRDAKITTAPDGRLMLSGASALHQPAAARHQSYVWFSDDGRNWTPPRPVADPDSWLWRITFHKGVGYGFAYETSGQPARGRLRLYRSAGGLKYDVLLPDAGVGGFPNEHALSFRKDGTAVVLLRRDPAPSAPNEPERTGTALSGTAKPPYTQWTWRDLGIRAGGPQILELPDGRLVAAVRLYTPKPRTALAWFNPDAATLREFLSLPSGGDTSYPGLVYHKGLLWVSYYSSHEGKTSVYLAKVKI